MHLAQAGRPSQPAGNLDKNMDEWNLIENEADWKAFMTHNLAPANQTVHIKKDSYPFAVMVNQTPVGYILSIISGDNILKFAKRIKKRRKK